MESSVMMMILIAFFIVDSICLFGTIVGKVTMNCISGCKGKKIINRLE